MSRLPHFIGRGWNYPVEIDPKDGSIRLAPGDDEVRQAVEIILSTELGERVMRPDFGAGMHDKVFAGLDDAALARYRTTIIDALRRHEPRIEDVEVTIEVAEPMLGRLNIDVGWQIRRTNRRDNLVWDFYVNRDE